MPAQAQLRVASFWFRVGLMGIRKSEVRGRRSEVGSQRSEDRSQRFSSALRARLETEREGSEVTLRWLLISRAQLGAGWTACATQGGSRRYRGLPPRVRSPRLSSGTAGRDALPDGRASDALNSQIQAPLNRRSSSRPLLAELSFARCFR